MKRVIHFTTKGVGELGVRVISSGTIFALAHVLGVTAFGEYSSAFAFASLFMILVDLGTNSIIARDVARYPDQRRAILGNANLLKLTSALVAFALIHVASRWSTFARDHVVLVDALAVVTITYTLLDYMGILLSGKEEFGWEAFLKVLCRLLISGAGIAVLLQTKSLAPVVNTMAMASIASLGVGALILATRFGSFPFLWDRDRLKRLMRSSLPVMGFVAFWTFYDNQDVLILNYLKVPADQVGLFWSGTKVIDVLKVFPLILSTIFFPELARFAQARESFIGTSRTLLAWALPAAVLVAAVTYLMAPWIIQILYGREFANAVPLLRLLMPAYFLSFFNSIFLQILIAKDQENQITWGALVACGGNLLCSLWWIPMFGTVGACYALIASEALYFFFQTRIVFRTVPDLLNPFRRTFG